MLHVSVISPEGSVYEGDAASVIAPAYDGEVGILTGHAPMMTLLGRGDLLVRADAGGESRFTIEGGFLQVLENQVRIVTERSPDMDEG